MINHEITVELARELKVGAEKREDYQATGEAREGSRSKRSEYCEPQRIEIKLIHRAVSAIGRPGISLPILPWAYLCC